MWVLRARSSFGNRDPGCVQRAGWVTQKGGWVYTAEPENAKENVHARANRAWLAGSLGVEQEHALDEMDLDFAIGHSGTSVPQTQSMMAKALRVSSSLIQATEKSQALRDYRACLHELQRS
jgi:hypothetical protein